MQLAVAQLPETLHRRPVRSGILQPAAAQYRGYFVIAGPDCPILQEVLARIPGHYASLRPAEAGPTVRVRALIALLGANSVEDLEAVRRNVEVPGKWRSG